MRLFETLAVSFFIARFTFCAAAKGQKIDSLEERKQHLLSVAKWQMSLLHAFDYNYNQIVTDKNIIGKVDSEAEVFAQKQLKGCSDSSSKKKCPAHGNELKNYFTYFRSMNDGLIAPTREQAYVNAYVLYETFLAALNFRMAVIFLTTIFSDPESGEVLSPQIKRDINYCGELFEYMRLFLNILFEDRIEEFKNIHQYGPYPTPKREEILNIAFMMNRAKNIVGVLSTLNLNFVRNKDDFTEDELKNWKSLYVNVDGGSAFRYNALYREVNPPPFEDSSRSDVIKLPTIFPQDNEADKESTIEMKAANAPVIYSQIWTKATYPFSSRVLSIMEYFSKVSNADYVETHKHEFRWIRSNLNYLAPAQTVTLTILKKAKEFIKIRDLPTNIPRGIYTDTEHRSDEIIRNNAIEILRRIKEIETEFFLTKEPKLSVPDYKFTVWDLLDEDINRGPPAFFLQKNPRKCGGTDFSLVFLRKNDHEDVTRT